jgi:G3E family GTPase
MIPVCLVTGFLGSGKTALLRHIARQHAGQRLVFLVNEFAAVDVDGPVLEHDAPGRVLGLPGGSIFCTCLVSEFIRVLKELPDRFGADIDGVVIEASGVANPKVVTRMLAETRLDEVYRIASVIAVADPGTFATLLQTLPNLRAQIEASDHVLVNKSDLFDEEVLRATEGAACEINPAAAVTRTQYGHIDLDLFSGSTPRRVAGEYAQCRDPNYAKASVRFTRPVDLARFLPALESFGPSLYRAKGFVPTPNGVFYVDVSSSGVQTKLLPEFAGPANLAIITSPDAAQQAAALVADIKAGRFY